MKNKEVFIMKDELYVYLIRSRNKDNRNIKNFKERSKTIVEYKKNEDKVFNEFYSFVEKGLPGEKTRLYRSVNARNEDKIREELIIRLIKDKPSMANLNRVLASVAQQVENRNESKWLFDFDCEDKSKLDEFIDDIRSKLDFSQDTFKRPCVNYYKTPHGYAVIVDHGFDTRELMEKWKEYDITLKKDELLFLAMEENRGEL